MLFLKSGIYLERGLALLDGSWTSAAAALSAAEEVALAQYAAGLVGISRLWTMVLGEVISKLHQRSRILIHIEMADFRIWGFLAS